MKMKFALLGFGRMGPEIERIALDRGHEVIRRFTDVEPLTSVSDLETADVLLDFSIRNAVLPALRLAARAGVPVVEGTTGWYDELEAARGITGLTMLYSPNFSLGVHQFIRLAEQAARLLDPLQTYDGYVHEWHHSGKIDSPSGTAKRLAKGLLGNLSNKDRLLEDTCHRKIEKAELHVTATRVGQLAGIHEVGFDSEFDSIQLRHTAHGRTGFAFGAVRAAEWVIGKTGIFTMDDFVASL